VTYKQVEKELIKRFYIKTLIDMDKRPEYYKEVHMPREDFVDHSYIAGSDEIVLGLYKDKNKKLMSLFHEIGHLLVDKYFIRSINYNTYKYEKEVWRRGLLLAKIYRIAFPFYCYRWAVQQMQTYKNIK
jgi:Zn-dependent peptidase ImmA (M78 family)